MFPYKMIKEQAEANEKEKENLKMVITDDYINELFKGANFGEVAMSRVEEKKKILLKTLKDQLNGYWSGHTAYHIAVNGGFLINAKQDAEKKLTNLGLLFMDTYKETIDA